MKYLQKTFRWFGPAFGVTLDEIKELDVDGIVTACHQFATGEVWPLKTISSLKSEIESKGLSWEVVESVNIHNDIKYGGSNRDQYIQNYIETLQNLSTCGIKVVCYNFMSLVDWTRTSIRHKLPNGAISLSYDPLAIATFDLHILKRSGNHQDYDQITHIRAKEYFDQLSDAQRQELQNTILSGLPGTKEPVPISVFRQYHEQASQLSKVELQENLAYFLNAVVPEAEKLGIKMAIHPDDPPFSIFGLPRIASTYEDFRFIFESYPSRSNGLTFCSGSLAVNPKNNLVKIIKDFGEKIHFIHLRNIQLEASGGFYESSHLKGSVPMAKVMRALIEEQKKRLTSGNVDIAIPLRPDHGHVILNDKDKIDSFYAGYSLIGRGMGIAMISGLEEGIREAIL